MNVSVCDAGSASVEVTKPRYAVITHCQYQPAWKNIKQAGSLIQPTDYHMLTFFSTLIGPAPATFCSHWLDLDHSVAYAINTQLKARVALMHRKDLIYGVHILFIFEIFTKILMMTYNKFSLARFSPLLLDVFLLLSSSL